MGFAKVRGRFSGFSGTVRFDEKDVSATSTTVRIDVDSLNTEHEWRDNDLKSDQWFDAEQFPNILFQSRRAERTSAGFDVIGDLTIRDVTKEVRIVMDEFSGAMNDFRADTQVIFVGHTAIRRKEFGVKGDRWSKVKEGITGVADEVEIELTILGKRINESNTRNFVRNTERPPGKVYKSISEDGLEKGLETFAELRNESESEIQPNVLKSVGSMLLKEGRVDDAIVVFQRNIEVFPERTDLHNSLGEAFAVKKDWKRAAESYNLALEGDPSDVNAKEVLRHIEL
jgi:polyisoprenoid-binding protein YceI